MLSSSTIEPGGSGQIRATVDTKGKSGRLSKRIGVRSSDPVRPDISLILTIWVEGNEAGTRAGTKGSSH